jgi:hypothetical protein
MLGMNLDTNLSSARAYAIKHHAEWPQGFLGPWSESDLPDQFGVEDLPSVMLLDPNGRVLLTGLHGGGIKSAVESALKP